jgi:hypothetical protein
VEARRALRAVADLPERQRTTLALKVAGFRYAEIQRLRGDVTYTKVSCQVGPPASAKRHRRFRRGLADDDPVRRRRRIPAALDRPAS